ncbi:MAG: pilus assembly protein, partial [Pseudomonadota bacterium]|nr:pilus assembly protein [Pseudomonadota bacterium]
MTSTRTKLLLASSLALVAAAGYQVYSLYAQASAPTLAQAPMNIENSVPPAFIMAVDDSNSMTFERIFPGGDGRMRWNSNTDSFFNNDGSFFSIGQACGSVDCYLYLYPHDGYSSSYSPGRAIPPLDVFGFARSHVYNASYFNPA